MPFTDIVVADPTWIDRSKASPCASSRMFTSESYHRSFWELLEHGVVLVDENKHIIEVNPYFVELIGISAADLIGTDISTIIGDRFWRADNVNLNAIIRGTQSSYFSDEELKYKQRQNDLIPVRVIVTRVPANMLEGFQHFIVQVYKIEKAVQIDGQPFINQVNQSYSNIIKTLLTQPWFIKAALWFLAILIVMLTLSGNLMPVIEKFFN